VARNEAREHRRFTINSDYSCMFHEFIMVKNGGKIKVHCTELHRTLSEVHKKFTELIKKYYE
jgi:hypothetical protein